MILILCRIYRHVYVSHLHQKHIAQWHAKLAMNCQHGWLCIYTSMLGTSVVKAGHDVAASPIVEESVSEGGGSTRRRFSFFQASTSGLVLQMSFEVLKLETRQYSQECVGMCLILSWSPSKSLCTHVPSCH